MVGPKHPLLVSGVQFIAIIVLTAVIFLIIDFSRRTTTGYYVSQAEKDLKAGIEAELALNKELVARRDEVRSDPYVERWAREEAHMVRPGDRPLILLAPDAVEDKPDAPQAQTALPPEPSRPNWHQWWSLFLDTEPGVLRAR